MNKAIIYGLICALALLAGCGNPIKNTESTVVEEPGATPMEEASEPEAQEEGLELTDTKDSINQVQEDSLVEWIIPNGLKKERQFWVGYFRRNMSKRNIGNDLYVGEGFYWNRENKISISIDEIIDGHVKGYSVVAGNNRPFEGTVETAIDSVSGKSIQYFTVKEPGDDKYDGVFTFTLTNYDLMGTWEAYNDLEIKYREYHLQKKTYKYDPDIMLQNRKQYVDWNKFIENTEVMEYDEDETEEWIRQSFSASTDMIYKINASNQLLKKEDVENLKRGDLTIIRNTIYARHGYSFKFRPLRIFFDAQDWYIPVHSDIKSEFTEIEKRNIRLLLSFEKNAEEYYDHFGRG